MGRRRAPSPPQLVAPRGITSGLPLEQTFDVFLKQKADIPRLQEFADVVNQQYRSTLEGAMPGVMGQAKQVSNIVSQLLGAEVPADVQAQIQRQSAQQALAMGAPATSGIARNITSRDLGLTSLNIQQAGMEAMPGLLQMAEALSPQQVQNYLFSTGQIRGEMLQESQNQANVANQNAINRYNYDVAKARSSGGFLGSIGGILGGIAGSFIAPGIGTALGASIGGGIGSAIGGGGFQLGAGQAGGLVGAIGGLGGQLFGGGLAGGGGGLLNVPGMGGSLAPNTTMFSPTGSAFTMPVGSFGQPFMSPNWTAGVIGNIPDYGFGGGGIRSTRGF